MEIKTEIITIGDEILIGQIVDTNSAWMATELNQIGIAVYQITTVSDNKEHILKAINEAFSRVDIILVTGGLGPTRDDITKKAIAEYFHTKLVLNEEVFEAVKARLERRHIPVTDISRGQAMVPEGCRAFVNEWGTAPGMWFEKEGKVLVSMPGVPVEMKGLMRKYILPGLQQHFSLPVIEHRTILTYGTYEAHLAGLLEDFENAMPEKVKLAYLPSQGRVRLRLSGRGNSGEQLTQLLDRLEKELLAIVGEYVYGKGEETLEEVTGKLLKDNGKTVVTAESCTGGYIAHLITSIPGSSDYYIGSVIAYAYEAKIQELGVRPSTLEKYGAVSSQTVTEMATGVRNKFGADYAIAVSGIAGPGGGTPEKPVGTIWLALAGPEGVVTQKLQLPFGRIENITRTSYTAINMLRKALLQGN
ncbi:MAG: competence/damage-inducible protein A [Chlorobi bacterium]|nr:competence/damage-inducible protein A [Chlorobiota bacterium]